jgi:cytoskeletal protein CcmA (bactofilin family)
MSPSPGKLGSRWIVLVAAPLMLMLVASVASAQQTALGGKVRSDNQVVIRAEETVPNDLYVFGETVRIAGRVEGDLVIFGGQVDVFGPVTGDVLVGAGNATISGPVDGDVRVGAGQAMIRGSVGEDALVGAGRTTMASGARVGGDLIFGTWQMVMDGTVAGNVLGSTDDYIKRGSVAGTETVNVKEPVEEAPPTMGMRLVDLLRRYVSILAVGALFLWLAPQALRAAAGAMRGRPLPSLGVGILGIFGFVVLVLGVLLVTILVAVVLGLLGLGSLVGTTVFGGILTEALIVFLFFLAVAFVAQAAVGLSLGRLLLREDARSFFRGFGALALGVLAVVIVSAIPRIGGLLEFLLVLLGLGALILAVLPRRRRALAS